MLNRWKHQLRICWGQAPDLHRLQSSKTKSWRLQLCSSKQTHYNRVGGFWGSQYPKHPERKKTLVFSRIIGCMTQFPSLYEPKQLIRCRFGQEFELPSHTFEALLTETVSRCVDWWINSRSHSSSGTIFPFFHGFFSAMAASSSRSQAGSFPPWGFGQLETGYPSMWNPGSTELFMFFTKKCPIPREKLESAGSLRV